MELASVKLTGYVSTYSLKTVEVNDVSEIVKKRDEEESNIIQLLLRD